MNSHSGSEIATALCRGEEEGVVGAELGVTVDRGVRIGELAEATEQSTDAMGDLGGEAGDVGGRGTRRFLELGAVEAGE